MKLHLNTLRDIDLMVNFKNYDIVNEAKASSKGAKAISCSLSNIEEALS